MASDKTNALRMLAQHGVACTPHTYDASDGRIDGPSVAVKIGMPAERVYKTLVTLGASGTPCVFVLPVACALDRKAAARAVGEKAVDMLRPADLERVTGYVRGGCSPVGMKKRFPTVLHSAAQHQPTVVVSAGRIGLQVELAAADLLRVTGGVLADIAVESAEGETV